MIHSAPCNASRAPTRRAEPTHWKQWLLQAQAGNQTALDSLLNELQPWLVRFVRDTGFHETDALDIVQDILLRFYQRLARFDPSRGSVRGWVAQMTRNHIIDLWRAQVRHRLVPLDEDVGSDRDDPASRLESEEDRGLVWEAIDGLKDTERAAVLLRFERGLTFQELSKLLRIPLSTAVARVRRGILSVRRQ